MCWAGSLSVGGSCKQARESNHGLVIKRRQRCLSQCFMTRPSRQGQEARICISRASFQSIQRVYSRANQASCIGAGCVRVNRRANRGMPGKAVLHIGDWCAGANGVHNVDRVKVADVGGLEGILELVKRAPVLVDGRSQRASSRTATIDFYAISEECVVSRLCSGGENTTQLALPW